MDQRLSLPASLSRLAETLEAAQRTAQDQATKVVSELFRSLEPALRAAHHESANRLNQQFRRIRAYESDREWCEALLDAAADLCRRAAFFSIRAGEVSFQGARGMLAGAIPPSSVQLADAPAFQNRGTALVARTAAELSQPIAEFFGESGETAALIPLAAADRIPGVLYVEGATDLEGLETIANFAGAALENHLLREEISPAPRIRSAPDAPPEHAAARRFASAAVARIVLLEFAAVRRGRAQRALFAYCAPSINSARARYQKEHANLPDYLHQEIVRTLAQDQPDLLGPGYPGPLGVGRPVS